MMSGRRGCHSSTGEWCTRLPMFVAAPTAATTGVPRLPRAAPLLTLTVPYLILPYPTLPYPTTGVPRLPRAAPLTSPSLTLAAPRTSPSLTLPLPLPYLTLPYPTPSPLNPPYLTSPFPYLNRTLGFRGESVWLGCLSRFSVECCSCDHK